MAEYAPPEHLWVPEGAVGSLVAEVRDVMKLAGRPLDASQLRAVEALTAVDKNGDWIALEAALLQPRQNGKTSGIITGIALTDALTGPPDRIAWTAHRLMTVRDSFSDMKRLIAGSDDLGSYVSKISKSHDSEGVEFKSGSLIQYMARTEVAARGLGGKRVIIDEALVFTAGQAGALLPILAARENAQISYASSAAKVDSTHLHDLIVRGRAYKDGTGDPTLVFAEWKSPGSWVGAKCGTEKCDHSVGSIECVLDQEWRWIEANPAVTHGRINIAFLRSMRRALKPREFAREHMGWDEAPEQTDKKITLAQWEARIDVDSATTGKYALALDVSPGGRFSSIASAGKREDGDVHLALIEHAPGTSWVIDRLVQIKNKRRPVALMIDAMSPAASLVPGLIKRGFHKYGPDSLDGLLRITASAELGQACASFESAVKGDAPTSWHRGDPIVSDAVDGAVSRPIGDGLWAWGRRKSEVSDVEIDPLVAMTLAHWGYVSYG
jgi:hypothetical protein